MATALHDKTRVKATPQIRPLLVPGIAAGNNITVRLAGRRK